MKTSKALKEVWEWKEKVYREYFKNAKQKTLSSFYQESVDRVEKKMGFKFKIAML